MSMLPMQCWIASYHATTDNILQHFCLKNQHFVNHFRVEQIYLVVVNTLKSLLMILSSFGLALYTKKVFKKWHLTPPYPSSTCPLQSHFKTRKSSFSGDKFSLMFPFRASSFRRYLPNGERHASSILHLMIIGHYWDTRSGIFFCGLINTLGSADGRE